MLKIAHELARRLEEEEIRYCVYKSIEALELDVNGDRGDLDILLAAVDRARAQKIFAECGYRRVLWPPAVGGVFFHSGYDHDSGKYLQLHLYTSLRLGDRANKQHSWSVEAGIIERAAPDGNCGLRVIHPGDEFAVLLARLLLKAAPKQVDLDRLTELARHLATEDFEIPLSPDIEQICGVATERVIRHLQQDDSFPALAEKSRPHAIRFFTPSVVDRLKSSAFAAQSRMIRLVSYLRHRLGFPSCKIRRIGRLWVLVGVDGSGKSTQNEALLSHPYLRMTGVKGLYFGENRYWFPGLSRLLTAHAARPRRRPVTILLLQLLAALDRRLRIVGAWLAMLQGRHVIGDRYYYDDLMKAAQQRVGGSRRWELYQKLVYSWLGSKPERTFFLDIDAQIAFARKQDFEFEKLERNVDTYRELLYDRPEVEVLDATADRDILTRSIVGTILD